MMRRKLALICLMMVKSDSRVDTAPQPAENPMEKPQNVTPEGAAPKANSLVNERKPEEERTKELSDSTAASSVRREWTVPKAIESAPCVTTACSLLLVPIQ